MSASKFNDLELLPSVSINPALSDYSLISTDNASIDWKKAKKNRNLWLSSKSVTPAILLSIGGLGLKPVSNGATPVTSYIALSHCTLLLFLLYIAHCIQQYS